MIVLAMSSYMIFAGVPFLRHQPTQTGIEEIIKHHYGNGVSDRANFDITVAIDPECTSVRAEFGNLQRLSPEEPVYALVIAASRVCDSDDEEAKERFKRLLRNCKYTFVPWVDNSSIRRRALDIREELRTAPDSVAFK